MGNSLEDHPKMRAYKIYKEYRKGRYFKEICEEYGISEKDLIAILNRNIKGNFNYEEIFKKGHEGQLEQIRHLNSRLPSFIPPESANK